MIEKILNLVREKKNILITGGAGVGKSYTLNKIIAELEKDNKCVIAKTAMTGMASLQYEGGGQTLHSCLGLGFCKNIHEMDQIIRSYRYRTELRYIIEAIDVLIVDEISMLRSDTFELVDALLKYTMESDEPFGGKQVIFSGDFMQLPPVVKTEEKLTNPWAFQSPKWNELNLEIVYLTEIKRQSDFKFATALNMIRAGVTNEAINNFFAGTVYNKIPSNVRMVKLLSTNNAVDAYNREQLNKCGTPESEIFFNADIFGITDKLKDAIIRDCPAQEKLELRTGCQVMILVNGEYYVNGSMGTYLGTEIIQDLDGRTLTVLRVKLFKDDMIVQIPMNEWKTERIDGDKKTKLAHFRQYPVKLAYAITIHKSQGMSIDYLEVDLNKCFAEHMAYVALSRAKTYEGLRVLNWDARSVKCNKDAFNFYMGLKNSGVI